MNFLITKIKAISAQEKLGLIVLILGHLIAAYTSFGFHHPDEHFQILEFANYWSGLSQNTSILPWEYTAQIRPWFQPMIHGIAIRFFSFINFYNPFSLVFGFRIFYSFLNILSIWYLWLALKRKFLLDPILFVFISMIWFFPYIHVRTSSENLSGIFITFAFAYYFDHRKYFWTGILFGFAFLARYQVALGIFGFGLALLIRDRKVTLSHLKLISAFLIPVGFGIILDRLGYGNWVFTAYRYFKVNLIDGVAATFNPYPWYQYFIWIFQLNPLLSIPLFTGTIIYAKKSKADELTYFVLTFFILHMGITNKEYRFLFPILNLAVIMSIVAFKEWGLTLYQNKKLYFSYAIVNLAGFCVSSLHGASIQTLWPVHMADRYSVPGETWITNRDYLDQFHNGYYHLKDHHVIVVHTGAELSEQLLKADSIKVLIDGQFQDPITQGLIKVVNHHQCDLITSAQPLFLFQLVNIIPTLNRLTYKAVYACHRQI